MMSDGREMLFREVSEIFTSEWELFTLPLSLDYGVDCDTTASAEEKIEVHAIVEHPKNEEWKCVFERGKIDRNLFSRLFSHVIMILRETLFTCFPWIDTMPSLAENQEVFKMDVFSHCFSDK